MEHSDDIDELKSKCICFECVGEMYLSKEIELSGKVDECSYCGQQEKSYTIEGLAERIETAFDDHFYRTSDQPDLWQQFQLNDRESNYIWYRDGIPVNEAIESAAGLSQEAAADVQMVLDNKYSDIEAARMGEETEFSSDTYYDEIGSSDRTWQEEWRMFERSLKKEARFFSRSAASHLASVFGGIDKLSTSDGRPLVLDVGPRLAIDHLFRARVFQSNDKLEEALCRPDLHLGSPPESLATAGRMNARGISVFYGATDVGVAIGEVRPPVGSKVAVAKFSFIRSLRLLDLTALKVVQDDGSIFDPSLKDRLERVSFLRSLEQRMTRPVMPDDEALDYLPTQAIADFLATESEPSLDGIIFPSVQAKLGRNVVLFHKAAKTEEMEFPAGTKIEIQTGYDTEDGWEVDYRVTESVPPTPPTSPDQADDDWNNPQQFSERFRNQYDDFRESTLQIDQKSIAVHQVDWVEYTTTANTVDRHRRESRNSKF